MENIAPGVYALSLEFELENVPRVIHPAVVETETGVILLDTGMPDHTESIETELDRAGFGFDDVELIVITHQDIDHAGALEEVKRRTGAPVFVHEDDAPYVAGDRELVKAEFGEYSSVPVDVELVDGVSFRTAAGEMRVVATPGHTPGHISLYLPDEKLLLVGDAITAEEAFDGPMEAATPDMDTAIDSVGRLAELEVERTLCFHGGLIEHDADRIRTIYENLES